MSEFSMNELAACARRELAYRRRVYPRLVGRGSMETKEAQRQIALMAAIVELLSEKQQPELL